jgi:hypothetical protein
VAHQSLAAVVGQLVGMAGEQGCYLGFDGLRQQHSRAVAQPQPPPTAPFAQNDNTVISPFSAFWGGAITDNVGGVRAGKSVWQVPQGCPSVGRNLAGLLPLGHRQSKRHQAERRRPPLRRSLRAFQTPDETDRTGVYSHHTLNSVKNVSLKRLLKVKGVTILISEAHRYKQIID